MLFFLTSCVFCFGDRGRRYFLRWDPNANSIVASTSAERSPEVVRLSYYLNNRVHSKSMLAREVADGHDGWMKEGILG